MDEGDRDCRLCRTIYLVTRTVTDTLKCGGHIDGVMIAKLTELPFGRVGGSYSTSYFWVLCLTIPGHWRLRVHMGLCW